MKRVILAVLLMVAGMVAVARGQGAPTAEANGDRVLTPYLDGQTMLVGASGRVQAGPGCRGEVCERCSGSGT